MNDAQKATNLFMAFAIAGILFGVVHVSIDYWPVNLVLVAISVLAFTVTGYLTPRVQHYSHALTEWEKTQDTHIARVTWVVMAVCVCSAFFAMLLLGPWTGAMVLAFGCIAIVLIAMAHPANRRYLAAVDEFDRTYHYETVPTAETDAAEAAETAGGQTA